MTVALDKSHGCVWSVTDIGSRDEISAALSAALGEVIEGWRVHWVGGWGKNKLFFLGHGGEGEGLDPTLTCGVPNSRTLACVRVMER